MLVVALMNYKDTKTKKSIRKGDIFETDRYLEINKKGHEKGYGVALGKVIIEEFSEPTQPKINYNDLTVSDLREKLDTLGIEYDSKARKNELIELLEKGDI